MDISMVYSRLKWNMHIAKSAYYMFYLLVCNYVIQVQCADLGKINKCNVQIEHLPLLWR